MNQYKEQWMEHANAFIPKTIKLSNNEVTMTWDNPLIPSSPEQGYKLAKAISTTRRAATYGAALAAADGPLPIGDVLGFTVFSAGTILAWYDYFS